MENQLPFNINLITALSQEAVTVLNKAFEVAKRKRNVYVTPEHVLKVLIETPSFKKALDTMSVNLDKIKEELFDHLSEIEKFPASINQMPQPSFLLGEMINNADENVMSCGKSEIEITHLVKAILDLNESWAQFLLWNAIKGQEGYFITLLIGDIETEEIEEDFFLPDDFELPMFESESNNNKDSWKKKVICLNDIYKEQNPLIGREEELNKTIRVLCRKEKNNPLHIGEPGVGKTALIYGLAAMIEEGKVPDKLKDSKIYRMDLGSLIAGTQYRGDFEIKLKNILEGAGKEKNAIIYIDEIHNLVGAGATGDGSLDASNFLKPYLEGGKIRFIGATTYDEYKRYFAKSKSIMRRFTNIDINEPTSEEAIHILRQLKERYEVFHKVKYTDEALEFAVKASKKFINDRFLPDKAIDLIDESGAEKQIEKNENGEKIIDKEMVSKVLARICKVETLAITEEDPQHLDRLEERISENLFGQEKAVTEVVESILMSKAGLSDENKPLAALLFVGPTGVGKTELAKLLSKELGIELIRFDMSEYTEKHAVAKLIGSPAGYVGYEDGGLLTDAIRKTPNAVLLLDEIEKAHSDIYNILLQVMDYARLTDNKGNKADFRNVVLIMTSNAGAQFASHANVGFASNVTRGDAMLKQVKKTFKPEFINRLSATVVFNDMSKEMAALILEKRLKELSKRLESKSVKLYINETVESYLLAKGFTKEYGARELDRVIERELKRKLMRLIIKEGFKEGGEIEVKVENNSIVVCKK